MLVTPRNSQRIAACKLIPLLDSCAGRLWTHCTHQGTACPYYRKGKTMGRIFYKNTPPGVSTRREGARQACAARQLGVLVSTPGHATGHLRGLLSTDCRSFVLSRAPKCPSRTQQGSQTPRSQAHGTQQQPRLSRGQARGTQQRSQVSRASTQNGPPGAGALVRPTPQEHHRQGGRHDQNNGHDCCDEQHHAYVRATRHDGGKLRKGRA